MKEAVKNISFRKEMKEFGRGIRDKPEAVHFVAFPARKKADITFGSDYIRHMLKDVHQVPDEVYEFYRNAYSNFSENDFKTLESERSAFGWAGKQAYIVMAHMMAVAALMGIDSCPLEGFIPKEMDRLLGEEHGLFDGKNDGSLVLKILSGSTFMHKKRADFQKSALLLGIIPGRERRRCRGG